MVRHGRKVRARLKFGVLPLTGGRIVIGTEHFKVARAGLLRRGLQLVRSGQPIARGWAFATWRIEHGDDFLTLSPNRDRQPDRYDVCRDEHVLGSIRLDGVVGQGRARSATFDTSGDLDLSVSLFVLWVVLFESGKWEHGE